MKDINFDFKQLQAFLAVIETGSFTAAAKKLNLTQSSISQQIANLENGLKTEVINRSQRPIQMTIAGQALYPLGKRLSIAVSICRNISTRSVTGIFHI